MVLQDKAREMHIAHIFSHAGLNGVSATGTALIRELLKTGHKITVVHRPDAWISKQSFDGDITMVPLDMGVRLLNFRGIYRLYQSLRKSNADVVHTHGSAADRVGGYFFTFGQIPTVADAAAQIVHIHWRFHDAVIAPSQYTIDFYTRSRLVSPSRLILVTHFISPGEFPKNTLKSRAWARAELGLPDSAFAIVILGSVGPRKNQSAAVPIIKQLVARGVNAHCVLIGGPDQKETRKITRNAAALGVRDRIHMAGHRYDARQLLTGFDVLLCTSRDEQGPLVLLEGMALGLPVYSTNVGFAPEAIINGENGLVFDLQRPAALIDALAKIADNPGELARIGRNNIARVKAEHSPGSVIPKIEAVYRTLIRNGQARHQQSGH